MESTASPYLQVVKGSRNLLFEFWDPLYISRTVGARNFKFGRYKRKKCEIRSKGVEKVSRDLLLKFLDRLYITRIVWARNFKFGIQIGHQGY